MKQQSKKLLLNLSEYVREDSEEDDEDEKWKSTPTVGHWKNYMFWMFEVAGVRARVDDHLQMRFYANQLRVDIVGQRNEMGLKSCYCSTVVLQPDYVVQSAFMHEKFLDDSREAPYIVTVGNSINKERY